MLLFLILGVLKLIIVVLRILLVFLQKKSKTGRPHHHKSKGGETVKVHIGKGYAQIKKSDKPEGMSFTQFLISLGASPKAAKVALKNHD